MDLSRFVFWFLLILYSSFTLASTLPDNLGIAFIHGTNDHRKDAIGGYWKQDFVDTLANRLPKPENYLIVACDYSQYMWHEAAAGCTADQLLAFIKEKQLGELVVYTHSNGSNVIRWMLSNPTFDPRYLLLSKKITKVVAISPSSGGTPLADEVTDGNIFIESIGWLIGYRNDAVRQQRVGDMAIYNDELLYGSKGRPSLPVPFNVVVSSDVTASPFSSASYCNGYTLNAGLKIAKLYLNNCADGFLNCISQTAAGDIWFFDVQKTNDNIPLSHNQSRHSCFGFDDILGKDLVQQGATQ